MLAKIESAYLNILRVVILIAATVALIVAAFGLVRSIPPLLRWSGITETTKPTGGTLADFISEQKITETSSESAETPATEPFILPELKTAAATIRGYLGKRGSITEKQWQIGLQGLADQLGSNAVAYSESIRGLTDQLKTSKGKPLSEQRVGQLVDWHKARFEADVQARAANEAEGNARFWVIIAGAGAAFLGFVLIVFIFLFVRIERNLRIVHTTRVPTYATEHTDA